MNKEQFLQSGLLEQYALGLTTPEESELVEQFIKEYPEIRQEVDQLQQALEQYASQYATPPPEGLKGKILSGIEGLQQPVPGPSPAFRARYRQARILSALSILGFFLMAVWSILRGQEIQRLNQVVSKTQMEYQQLQTACESQKYQQQLLQEQIALVKDVDTKRVTLSSLDQNPKTLATALWNPQSNKCMVHLGALPPPPEGKIYQIWADVDGEMINAGVLEYNVQQFQPITFIPKAESLNITLEPAGGSDHPTVALLQVSGAV